MKLIKADKQVRALARWTRFNAVGILGFAIQVLFLHAATRWLGIHYLPATLIAVEAAVIHNFLWHERWTWKDKTSASSMRRFCEFQFTNGAISLIGNFAIMRFLIDLCQIPITAANVVSVGICSLFNFLASDRIVFR